MLFVRQCPRSRQNPLRLAERSAVNGPQVSNAGSGASLRLGAIFLKLPEYTSKQLPHGQKNVE